MSIFLIIGLGLLLVASFAIGQGTNGFAVAATAFFFVGSVVFYLLPAIIAHRKKHPNATAITVLTLGLGWTLLGWVVALVWAHAKPATVQIVDTSNDVPATPRDPPTMLDRLAAPEPAHAPPPINSAAKKCPFCAEDIRAEAIKCKHCGSDLLARPSASVA